MENPPILAGLGYNGMPDEVADSEEHWSAAKKPKLGTIILICLVHSHIQNIFLKQCVTLK